GRGGGGARGGAPAAHRPPLEDGGRRRRRKRGPEAQNRHGGAPRGERPASWDARRLASAWRIASRYARRVPRTHPNVSRRSAHPSFGVSEAKLQTPDAEMRRGNEMGCLKS